MAWRHGRWQTLDFWLLIFNVPETSVTKMDVVILLGAPGSGKGTVAGRLVVMDKTLRHVSSGELLRDAVEHHTAAGTRRTHT